MTYKVIVADNSPSVRKALELALPETEYELFFFDNGLELAKALPDIAPDALLLSLSLPGMDGYRTAAHVRGLQEFRHASVIFLRGSFEAFDPDKAAGLDYEEVVRKPFDSEALARRLKSGLDRKHDLLSFPAAPPDGDGGGAGTRAEGSGGKSASLADLVRREVAEACAAMEKRLRASVLETLDHRPADVKKAGRSRQRSRP